MIPAKPKRILMIKSHSMGVGDVLRSSAAWRMLINTWPGVELHLLFLSKHAGYTTEELIKEHHLLSSASFITVRSHDPSAKNAQRLPICKILAQVQALTLLLNPDLIIDFEPHGIKTSFITWMAAKACHATTVGIAQFPFRSWFYMLNAPSMRSYARTHGLTEPFDYTNRDFVALQAFGIERNRTPIELSLTPAALSFKQSMMAVLPQGLPVVGLNIGCATEGASVRRPDLNKLADCFSALSKTMPHSLVISGAPFERGINSQFMQLCAVKGMDMNLIFDYSGHTTLLTLAGLIDACSVFISSDSGPYHLSVGLKKLTICWFNFPDPAAYHEHSWVKRLINPSVREFLNLVNSSTKCNFD